MRGFGRDAKMQGLGILIELRGEGAANAGIYRHTWRYRASSIFVLQSFFRINDHYALNKAGYDELMALPVRPYLYIDTRRRFT